MDSLLQDIRYAARSLRSRPGFSAIAVLTLAIGIGANTVAFSALSALLYKPLRFEGARELGWIGTRAAGNSYSLTSLPDFLAVLEANRTFEGIAAEARRPLSMIVDGRAQSVWGLLVSSNYLTLLRVRPELGRVFTPDDRSGGELPVVVSHRFWSDRLGGGTSVAGRTLTLNGRSASVVGVLPDTFQGPGGFFEPDVWVPLERMALLGLPDALSTRPQAWLSLVGRMKPHVTPAQAGADLQSIATKLAADFPATNAKRSFSFSPMIDGNPEVMRLAPWGWVAMGLVGLILLIACFNVAGLLLSRASERQRELSIRTALGAGRLRIIRLLILEGAVLALLSGMAAVAIAFWSADLLAAFSLPTPIPQRLHIPVDGRLIAFVSGLVVVASLLPAFVPAVQATRTDPVRSLKADSVGGGRSSRARNVFVIAQVAGSTLFLAVALLFAQSFRTSASTSPGFDVAHTLVVELTPTNFGYDAPRARALTDALLERVRSLSGVRQAAVADRVPFYVGFPKTTKVADRAVFVYATGRDHFAALGIPLLAGRDFTDADITAGTNVIVSRALATRLFPDRNAVGEWVREDSDGRQWQVVGIASDVIHHGFGERRAEYLYKPIAPWHFNDTITLVVRTDGDPRSALGPVLDQLHALDPKLPGSAKTMSQRMELPLWPSRTGAGFFGVCGLLSLLLATVGVFGVTYFAVCQRTREFGIRSALGATPRAVMQLVLGEGLWLTLPGVALGLAGAIAAGRLVGSALFGISPADPSTFVATAAVQVAAALAACVLPAYRATAVDPLRALRHE
jgi:putative ABC transport system permease protein